MSHSPRNWFNSNQLQIANRTHNAAGFTSRVNNVGNFILDAGVSSAFNFSYSPSGLIVTTNAGDIQLSTVSGDYILGNGAGANLPATNGAPAFALVLDANGVVGKSILSITDTNFFNDNLVQDANRTHNQASFNTEIDNVALFILDQGVASSNNFRYGASGLLINSVGATSVNFSVLDAGTVAGVVSTAAGTGELELTDIIGRFGVTDVAGNEGLTYTSATSVGMSVTDGVLTSTEFYADLSIFSSTITDTVNFATISGSLTDISLDSSTGTYNLLTAPPTGTPDFILGVITATGAIEKITPANLVTLGGGAVASSLTKELTINEKEVAEPVVAAAQGQTIVTVPLSMNGMLLTDVTAAVFLLGVATAAQTLDIFVVRRRAGVNVDMMTAPVTLLDTQYFNNNGTIDAANDDIATGDVLYIYTVNGYDTTDAQGLTVTLTFA